MPIYEFYCEHCGVEFEALLPMSQKDSAPCEHCGRPAVRIASCCFGGSTDSVSSAAGACFSGG